MKTEFEKQVIEVMKNNLIVYVREERDEYIVGHIIDGVYYEYKSRNVVKKENPRPELIFQESSLEYLVKSIKKLFKK